MKKLQQFSLPIIMSAIFLVLAAFAFQFEGVTNFDGVHLQATSFATATPLFMVNNNGGSRSVEVRNANSTPVWSVDTDGTINQTGSMAGSSATFDTDVTIDDTINLDDTDSALTGAQTITPTYTYLQVSPVAVLTATLATGAAADGDLFIIHNLVATTTTVVDTGATAGGGNITLNQDDIAIFIFGDGVWVEIASPDNS